MFDCNHNYIFNVSLHFIFYTLSYDINYSYQLGIICILLNSFKYSYPTLIFLFNNDNDFFAPSWMASNITSQLFGQREWNWLLGLRGPPSLQAILACGVKFIAWYLRHSKRGMLMETNIFCTCHTWVLIYAWFSILKWSCVKSYQVENLIKYPASHIPI